MMIGRPYSLVAELEEWQALLSDTLTFRQSLPDGSNEAVDADERIKHYRRMIDAVSQDIEEEKNADRSYQ